MLAYSIGRWHNTKTKLLIGADGANSFVREQAFIDLDVLDYKQAAISCAIKHLSLIIMLLGKSFTYWTFGIFAVASLEESENGYWQSIVWTLPDDYADEYSALSDREFMQLLTRESQHMLGEVLDVRSRPNFH